MSLARRRLLRSLCPHARRWDATFACARSPARCCCLRSFYPHMAVIGCDLYPRAAATYIFTRCQGDRYIVNRGEGLTTIDFSGGDAATARAIDRSEGQREKRAVVDLLSFDSENELIADGVGKVSLLVGVDATVVVHKEDGLV
ncbi:hypothetical protein B296_00024294 [Ensete ventricosum]|uniref:Uncharacterized protein n=1 Tax=Ensete ventricosum TaxID=4639 RepID=A0A426XDW7_ENSVE|nr:hypothetical protein B296_00024294 [Ensete ventricosum]